MTTREAFERGTDTFNAHDIDGFAEVLADDVVFVAPGPMRGEGRAACAAFYASWFGAFPDAHVEVDALHGGELTCSGTQYLNRASPRLKLLSASFHPNAAGQERLARAVATALANVER